MSFSLPDTRPPGADDKKLVEAEKVPQSHPDAGEAEQHSSDVESGAC